MPVIGSKIRKMFLKKSRYKLHEDNQSSDSKNGCLKVLENLKWKLKRALHEITYQYKDKLATKLNEH